MSHAVEDAKRLAAERALDFVSNDSIVGLGTGSTMRYALEDLGRRLADGRLRGVRGVPTSEQTATIARRLGIPLAPLERGVVLSLAIDGADEIDPSLDLIKGLGGALLREKIVAAAAAELVIVADGSKLVPRLGSLAAVPIEVVPFAIPLVLDRLDAWPGHADERRTSDGRAFRTDEGHAILDYRPGPIADPAALDRALLAIPGVVDHGLFLGMATRAIVADATGVTVLERPRS